MAKYKQQCPNCWRVYNLDWKPKGRPVCNKCKHDGFWKTGDGDILHVSQMTDSHLVNLSNYLARKAQEKFSDNLSAAYTMAGFSQGEMAQDAIWSQIDDMESYRS